MTNVNWDRIADDYRQHRQGYPDRFYRVLREEGVGFEGGRILDLGAGTLDVARGFARRGARAFAIEPSGPLMQAGVQMGHHAQAVGVDVVAIAVGPLDQPFAQLLCHVRRRPRRHALL